MSEPDDTEEQKPKRPLKLVVLVGILLALLGAAGGFFAVQSGMISSEKVSVDLDSETQAIKAIPEIEFVKLDPIVISLPAGQNSKLVRFSAQLEVKAEHRSEVETVLPRIVDVLNGYLRAVEPTDFEQPTALVKLRAQMLRRIQLVTGNGRVRDLLIMEFVLT